MSEKVQIVWRTRSATSEAEFSRVPCVGECFQVSAVNADFSASVTIGKVDEVLHYPKGQGQKFAARIMAHVSKGK